MNISTVKAHFWKWFSLHAQQYYLFNTLPQNNINYLLDELNMHLRAYCRFLQSILEKDRTTGMARLIITANGRAASFARADSLVKNAPAIDRWEIVALSPPTEPMRLLDVLYPGVDIDPCRLWFDSAYDTAPGEKKAIVVYSELYTPAINCYFECAVRWMIQNILGERSAALDIGDIIPANLSEAPRNANLQRMDELPAFVSHNLSYHWEVGAGGELRQKR